MLPTTWEGIPDNSIIVSLDEVARGSLCGPVTVGAVIWDPNYEPKTEEDAKLLDMIKDSKKLSAKNRDKLSKFIKENAVEYAIFDVNNEEIDRINILQATFKAMHGALDSFTTKFDRIMVDGDRFKSYMNDDGFVPHTCIVDGDNKLLGIAAASIIAKVHRDNLIEELGNSDDALKVYGWEKNRGYGTQYHIAAIKEHGISKYHRKSFIHFM